MAIYQRKDMPGIWIVSIRRKGFEPVYEKFDNEKSARIFNDEREAELLRERARNTDPRASLPDSGNLDDELLLTTISLYKKSPSLTARINKILPTIVKHIGNVKLGQLTKDWMKNFTKRLRGTITYRGKPYAYSSIEKYLVTINIILKWRAEELRMAKPTYNFSTKEIFPRGWKVKRERRLEKEEEAKLMAFFETMEGDAGIFWRELIHLALETGARLNEMVLAEWKEFKRSTWHIPEEHTKTFQSRKTPLTSRALQALDALRPFMNPNDTRIFHCWKNAGVVSALFARWKKKLGIENLRFHDLRHEAIARMCIRSPNTIANMKAVGHTSMEMHDQYANLRAEELAALMLI